MSGKVGSQHFSIGFTNLFGTLIVYIHDFSLYVIYGHFRAVIRTLSLQNYCESGLSWKVIRAARMQRRVDVLLVLTLLMSCALTYVYEHTSNSVIHF